MIIQATCARCGILHETAVSEDAYMAYARGAMVQEAFPNMSADYRELFFLSGICGPCFDILFPEDDDWNYEEDNA